MIFILVQHCRWIILFIESWLCSDNNKQPEEELINKKNHTVDNSASSSQSCFSMIDDRFLIVFLVFLCDGNIRWFYHLLDLRISFLAWCAFYFSYVRSWVFFHGFEAFMFRLFIDFLFALNISLVLFKKKAMNNFLY